MSSNNINSQQQKDNEIRRLREELDIVFSSPSWRMTAPCRWIFSKIRNKRTMIRDWMSDKRGPIRRFYFTLPLPMNLKTKLADTIDNKLGNRNIEVKGRYEELVNKANTLLEQIKTGKLFSKIEFPSVVGPKVSIIIPVYNKIEYTLTCLTSIYEYTGPLSYEIIIVDDNSSDTTRSISEQVQGLKYLRNDNNLGYIRSCNIGAEAATGEYLVFLNNDTVVTEGWVEELVRTFQLEQSAGIVGPKLISPNSRLQEAGGIVWRDGSAWNYGKGDDPAKPQYNYVRKVDYCSGACFAIPGYLFKELGGFDRRYVPAYYEDTDIAFKVKDAGKDVFYQPLSEIIHFEGITCGTNTNYGVKSYQRINQSKFFERWKHTLKKHRPYNSFVEIEKERSINKYALIIDATTMTPDQDAGSVIACNYMKIFISLGYKITFAPSNLAYISGYTPDLQRLGVECLYTPYVNSINAYLKESGERYDVVFLARASVADLHIDDVKKYCHKAFVIFDTVDLHFLREMREAAIRAAEERRLQELCVISKSDLTIVSSPVEYDILNSELSGRRIENIYPPWEVPGIKKDFDGRNDIAFIGGFQHPPNADAVKHFVNNIFPRIKSSLPDVCFYVIGSKTTKEVMDLASDDIIVLGYVKDLVEYLETVRLTVVPLRYGAGIKGKIISSLGCGVPVVTTSIGAEGMGLIDNEDVLIADGPERFASSVATLYSDKELWNRLSERGLKKVRKNFSMETAKIKLQSFINQNSNIH